MDSRTVSGLSFSLRPEWHAAMADRVSKRSYTGEPLTAEQADRLGALCAEVSAPFPGLRAVFVQEPSSDIFTGIMGGYGQLIQDSPAFIAFVAGGHPDPATLPEDVEPERVPMGSDVDMGLLGEALVLDATVMGLGTCWVAGTFSRSKTKTLIELADGERVRAVTPVGVAAEREGTVQRAMQRMVKARSRKSLDELAPGHEDWPAWAQEAAEAVQIAPSGKNGQPWRMRMDDGAFVLSKPRSTALVPTYMADLGIALLHAQLAVQNAGVAGAWERLDYDTGDIARFVPAEG